MLDKVLSFDRSLALGAGKIEVAVIHHSDYPESTAAKAEFLRATPLLHRQRESVSHSRVIQLENDEAVRDMFSVLNVMS